MKKKKRIESLDINKIQNDDIFIKLMINLYKLLTETIDLILQEQPEMAFKLFLDSASQVNSINCNREKLQESCTTFLKSAINIFEEGRFNQNKRYDMFIQISSILITLNINKEVIGTIVEDLINCSQKMIQREEQCKAMLILSQLYFTIFKDGKKVMDCLNKARRFADFAMTNPKNLILFVEYLNKILYFIDKEEKDEKEEKILEIKPEQIEDLIELIKGHIRTIKNIPADDISYLKDIEVYFNNTLNMIRYRKMNSNKKDFYSSINI